MNLRKDVKTQIVYAGKIQVYTYFSLKIILGRKKLKFIKVIENNFLFKQ